MEHDGDGRSRRARHAPALTPARAQSDKKFYLDQAKKLKDNFNSKYPDYVYRRRPNNSRKKRKAEPAHGDDPDGAALDDDGAYDDPSPVDGPDELRRSKPLCDGSSL